ncbi:hypothetical protein D3C78_1127590 [compost metagenome]
MPSNRVTDWAGLPAAAQLPIMSMGALASGPTSAIFAVFFSGRVSFRFFSNTWLRRATSRASARCRRLSA